MPMLEISAIAGPSFGSVIREVEPGHAVVATHQDRLFVCLRIDGDRVMSLRACRRRRQVEDVFSTEAVA